MLHAEIMRIILANDTFSKQQVLVLVTGDGNNNRGQTTFPEVAEIALTKDWNVELWSWEQSLNPIYFGIQTKFPDQMTIKYLDAHREQITFIQNK
jgi:hypothetical protein